MKITKTEEVTRTYCDVCGNEVTYASNTGSYDEANPQDDYTVCLSTHFDLDLTPRKGVRLTCEMLAGFYIDNPSLAPWRFKERNNGTVHGFATGHG